MTRVRVTHVVHVVQVMESTMLVLHHQILTVSNVMMVQYPLATTTRLVHLAQSVDWVKE
jgi:hypothetical protein